MRHLELDEGICEEETPKVPWELGLHEHSISDVSKMTFATLKRVAVKAVISGVSSAAGRMRMSKSIRTARDRVNISQAAYRKGTAVTVSVICSNRTASSSA